MVPRCEHQAVLKIVYRLVVRFATQESFLFMAMTGCPGNGYSQSPPGGTYQGCKAADPWRLECSFPCWDSEPASYLFKRPCALGSQAELATQVLAAKQVRVAQRV